MVLSFLIIYILFFSVIHLFAYDATSASLGIGEFPEESSFKIGSIAPGSTSHPKYLSTFNPGVFPVKGVIIGSEELTPFIDRTTFEIAAGETKNIAVTATAPNASKNGTYMGTIMMYSSPIWFIIPDEFTQSMCSMKLGGTVFWLDMIAACMLTALTIGVLVSMDYLVKKYANLKIWERGIRNPPHHIKVVAKKDEEGNVFAELEGAPAEEKKEEKKPKKKEKKTKPEEKKEEKKPETKSEEKKPEEKPAETPKEESKPAEEKTETPEPEEKK